MLDKMKKAVFSVRKESSSGQANGNAGIDRGRLFDLLQVHFGHSSFRGRQLEAIEAVLSAKDCFCLMPTGSGKSLCYQIPALVKTGIVLVVSPLIALMENQVAGLKAQKIAADFLSSTQNAKVRSRIHEQLDSGRPSLRLLYVTPELIATPKFTSKLQKLYDRGLLSLIAIDEAHCISSWGHDFRPSYRKLSTLRTRFPGISILALTATASKEVQEDVIRSLNLDHPLILKSSFNRPNISYEVRYKDLLGNVYEDLRKLINANPGECCIVYCHSRATCDVVGARLLQDCISSRVYHAGLGEKQRSQALEDWTSGRVPVVVATVAFGMGIDRRDVRLVCHFDVPKSLEGFYQESGRAGRDGMPARSILYYGVDDRQFMQYLITKPDLAQKHQDSEAVEKAIEKKMESFSKMVEYCEEARCRRQAVLAHFGEHVLTEVCAKTCDVCEHRSHVVGNLEVLALGSFSQREACLSSYKISSNKGLVCQNSSEILNDTEQDPEDDISDSDEDNEAPVAVHAVVSKEIHSALSQKGEASDMNTITQTFRDTVLKQLEEAVTRASRRLNMKSVAADNASIILESECFQESCKAGKSVYNSHLATTIKWLSTCSGCDLESRLAVSMHIKVGVKPSSKDIDISYGNSRSPNWSISGSGFSSSLPYSGTPNEDHLPFIASKTTLSFSLPPFSSNGYYPRQRAPSEFPFTRGLSAPFKKPRQVKDL